MTSSLSPFFLTVLFAVYFLQNDQACAQSIIRCSATEYLQLREEKFPGTIQKLNELREAAQKWSENHPEALRSTYTIPVVVHVVWHKDEENISLSKILSQIDVLNEDFNRQNIDTSKTPSVWKATAGNVSVTFCLAHYAPDGSETDGITRTYTDETSFEIDDKMKHNNTGGEDAWSSENYLNIWVCHLIDYGTGGDVLGYASQSPDTDVDGVVISTNVFGRSESLTPQYDEGRTCTHEVGHWLGLAHTFDGGCYSADDCDDTPPEFDHVFGCPSFPLYDACTADSPGVMFMNYMDYTDDDCMNLFTQCQCNTMIGILNTSRQLLLSSPAGCDPFALHLDAGINKVAFPDDTLTAQGFSPSVQLTNHGTDEIQYVQINYQVDGQPDSVYYYSGSLLPQQSVLVTLDNYFTSEGGHMFYAWTSNPNHGDDEYINNDSASEEFFVRSSFPKNTPVISVQSESPTDHPVVKIENPSAGMLHLRIVNILGQIVQEGNWSVIDHPSFMLDLSDLPLGIYFLYGKIGYDYVKKKVMVVRE